MNFENHTKFPAGWTLGFEPDGRELLVVVVKATFDIPKKGGLPQLADEQVPLVEADEFTGEPGHSATLYETDYAHRKPYCDVLLNGSAYASKGLPVERVTVSIQVGNMKKAFNVIGDRRWDRIMMQDTPSLSLPFLRKTVSYDYAYGGVDIHPDHETKVMTYGPNPVGMGYYPYSSGKHLQGKPLPNTEEIGKPIKASKSGSFSPMAFGPVGRNFSQRIKFAGTYDQKWLDHRAPFWPDDFDYQYFQAAPVEQCIPYPQGGEPVIIENLTPEGITAFTLPKWEVPVLVVPYQGKAEQRMPVIDTVFFEPDQGRFTMAGRIGRPLKRDCFELKEILVGESITAWQRKQRSNDKPYYKGISEFIKAQQAKR